MSWTFLTNHALVLVAVASDPSMRIREIASRVGITERAVQRILQELEAGGHLYIAKEGRRNQYRVHGERPLRHPMEAGRTTADLVHMVLGDRVDLGEPTPRS